MYCIKCGVALADTETVCPLCQTRVYHPELHQPNTSPLYPEGKLPPEPRFSLGMPIALTVLWVLGLLTVLLCDVQVNRSLTWSGFVAGAMATGYVALILPGWFRRPNPVIFVPCFFASAILYLLYIDLATAGGWFLSFAFPVTGSVGLIATALVTLLRYVKKGTLYIFGGALLALGGFMPVVELLLNRTFHREAFFGWSLYPLMALVLLGGYLIFLAICRPARETMRRKLFF